MSYSSENSDATRQPLLARLAQATEAETTPGQNTTFPSFGWWVDVMRL